MNEPSERMQSLIAALEASTFAGHAMHVNALKAAIAELEQRAEKWKRVAVAKERCNQAIAAYNRAQIRGELLNAREDTWTKADLEFAEAIEALGDEWTEAVRSEKLLEVKP